MVHYIFLLSMMAAAPDAPPQPTTTTQERLLVVWDFDWSLVNQNSDTYVIEKLDPSGEIWAEARGRKGAQWTALMDWALGELHSRRGVTPAQLREALATIPVMPAVREAMQRAAARGNEQRILSDANSFYISSILSEPLHAASHFSAVETNPAALDPDGRLRVQPHQPAGIPHGCPNCPPNLCKGRVLQQWLEERPSLRCIYVGDGGGDFCPAARLRPGDILLARRAPHGGLLHLARTQGIAAPIVEWGGEDDSEGADLLAAFSSCFERSAGDNAGRGSATAHAG